MIKISLLLILLSLNAFSSVYDGASLFSPQSINLASKKIESIHTHCGTFIEVQTHLHPVEVKSEMPRNAVGLFFFKSSGTSQIKFGTDYRISEKEKAILSRLIYYPRLYHQNDRALLSSLKFLEKRCKNRE